jgi:outer membrane cobalamin receptor
VIGIGVRGNWAFEGKVLITLDGQMLNETSYGSYSFAQRVIKDNIEKIEIIRGPGSVIYGGVAGLAVINIITRPANKSEGISVSNQLGFANGLSRSNTQVTIGKSFLNGFSFNINGCLSEGNLSNRILHSSIGDPVYYKDSSEVRSYFFNVGLQYKNLDVKYYFEDYKSEIIDGKGRTVFGGHFLNAQYNLPIASKLTLIPKLLLGQNNPWSLENVPDNTYNTTNFRYTGGLQLIYEPVDYFTYVSGIEAYYDDSRISESFADELFYNGRSRIGFTNIAFYNQAMLRTRIANFNLGLRIDNHSSFGTAFAPRLGITKTINKWHFKFLYSNAFKAPTIQNINANPDLQPENIYSAEVEAGYQLTPSISIKQRFSD